MTDRLRPGVLDAAFASALRSTKADVVDPSRIRQHGAVILATTGWPGWPVELDCSEAIIEMFVATGDGVEATSNNHPYVSAWEPLAGWMNQRIRSELASVGVEIDGDAYITASITSSAELEGQPHLDDDMFIPADNVGVVAIIGQHAGPAVAIEAMDHEPLRPSSQVNFNQTQLDDFAGGRIEQCQAYGDELALFAQFGQLHAGPTAEDLQEPTRQLLVFRAKVKPANKRR